MIFYHDHTALHSIELETVRFTTAALSGRSRSEAPAHTAQAEQLELRTSAPAGKKERQAYLDRCRFTICDVHVHQQPIT